MYLYHCTVSDSCVPTGGHKEFTWQNIQTTGIQKELDTTCKQNASRQTAQDNETLFPIGRRNRGRPLKRLLDTWDRNGSTSGLTAWQTYDDDDDDDDGFHRRALVGLLRNFRRPLNAQMCYISKPHPAFPFLKNKAGFHIHLEKFTFCCFSCPPHSVIAKFRLTYCCPSWRLRPFAQTKRRCRHWGHNSHDHNLKFQAFIKHT